MSQKLKLLLLGGIVINLLGCSHLYGDKGVIKNRETDYLKAQNIAPMQVPPGYKATIENNYPVSEKEYPASKTRVDLTPPGLNNSAPATPAQ